MSVNVFAQFAVGAASLTLGAYLLRSRDIGGADGEFIVPLVFVLSGWAIIVFAMEFDPFAVVAALLFLLAMLVRNSEVFGIMAFIFAVIGGLSFGIGALGNDPHNSTKQSMVAAATVLMGAFWMFGAPIWTAIVSWTMFGLVVATPAIRTSE